LGEGTEFIFKLKLDKRPLAELNDSWLELEVLMIKDEVIEEQKQNSTEKTEEFNFSNSAEQNLNYEEQAVF
jgi:hypothetical protein